MEATTASPSRTGFFNNYKSPWRALAWRFRKSRDGWKRKYSEIKKELTLLTRRWKRATQSADRWKTEAEQLRTETERLRSEAEKLRSELECRPAAPACSADEKKGSRLSRPSSSILPEIITSRSV